MSEVVLPDWGDKIGAGFDSLMGSIAQGKQQAIQARRQAYNDQLNRILMTQQLGVDPNALMASMNARGVRPMGPQNQAMMPPSMQMAQQPPGAMQMGPGGPAMAGMGPSGSMAPSAPPSSPMGLPGGSGGSPVANGDLWDEFQNFARQMQGQKTQMGQANLGHMQAETNELNARADYYRNKPTPGAGGLQSLSPDQKDAVLQALAEGRLKPQQINSRGAKLSLLADTFIKDPRYDATKADVGFAAARSGAEASARLNQGGAAQMTARTANAARKQLSILERVSKEFPRADNRMMNTPIIALSKQKGSKAGNWLFALNSFRNEYASALMRGHMPQEGAQAEVEKALPDNITPQQLQDLIPLAKEELDALVEGQMTPAGSPPLLSEKLQGGMSAGQVAAHPQDSQAVAWAKSHSKDPRAAKILKVNGQ